MTVTSVIHCGESGARGTPHDGEIFLDLNGSRANVHLQIGEISSAMAQNIPEPLVDLLEIAAYVHAADQAVTRGGPRDTGEAWRRDLEFRIPVRSPGVWSRPEVKGALIDVLSFLTDDDYDFRFSLFRRPPAVQQYLDLTDSAVQEGVDQVQLFSGGVDSLAGAIQAAHTEGKNIVLVNHRSAPKRVGGVEDLVARVRERTLSRVQRVGVWATKAAPIGVEFTQRSRSFLYASLASSVASMLGLDSISFYENGVTSMNFPIAGQVVGSRATRTTHPQTLRGLSRLFSEVLGRDFTVQAPFLWRTKSDVMRLAVKAGCGDLLRQTVSCSRTVEATVLHPHCGRCSQCLDRRFAALSLGLGDEEDPSEAYKVDLLLGERPPGEDRAMAEDFVQRALAMVDAGDSEFFQRFPEATRVLRHTGLATDEAARRVLDIHRRHGADVRSVLAEGLKAHAEDFQAGRLPDSCLLALTVPEKYVTTRQRSAGSPGDQPTFLCEGATWSVTFGNETRTFDDSVGMRYLALLLENPGYEFHAAELMKIESGELDPVPSGADGVVSDWKSVREYQRAMRLLPAQIRQAEAAGDTESVLLHREELDRLERHLSAVVGRGGRLRREGTGADRERKAVGNAIGRALTEIDRRKHPLLRSHLGRYLTKGLFCAYRPDPTVRWTVKRRR